MLSIVPVAYATFHSRTLATRRDAVGDRAEHCADLEHAPRIDAAHDTRPPGAPSDDGRRTAASERRPAGGPSTRRPQPSAPIAAGGSEPAASSRPVVSRSPRRAVRASPGAVVAVADGPAAVVAAAAATAAPATTGATPAADALGPANGCCEFVAVAASRRWFGGDLRRGPGHRRGRLGGGQGDRSRLVDRVGRARSPPPPLRQRTALVGRAIEGTQQFRRVRCGLRLGLHTAHDGRRPGEQGIAGDQRVHGRRRCRCRTLGRGGPDGYRRWRRGRRHRCDRHGTGVVARRRRRWRDAGRKLAPVVDVAGRWRGLGAAFQSRLLVARDSRQGAGRTLRRVSIRWYRQRIVAVALVVLTLVGRVERGRSPRTCRRDGHRQPRPSSVRSTLVSIRAAPALVTDHGWSPPPPPWPARRAP